MGDPNFLAAIVDDGVLVQVMIGGSGTRRGGEELGEVFDLVGEGTWDNVKAPSCLKVRLARLVLRRVLIEREVFERYQRLFRRNDLEGHKGE